MKKRCFIFALLLILPTVNVHAATQNELEPMLNSEAVILTDSISGDVLYEKNSHEKIYPASLTKIATAIYAIEKANLADMVTVSEAASQVEGTRVYLMPGEKVTLRHLIQGLLINSGNDAGLVIAEHLHGSPANFATQINQYLQEEIGVRDTHFTNPHGLFDEDHYTTASDLAIITNYALKNDVFKEIFATKQLEWHGEGWETTLFTHHLLLKGDYPYEGISGGKTGFVNESGHTLATTAANENIGLTVITINTPTKRAGYADTMELLDYGFDHYQTERIPSNQEFLIADKTFKAPQTLFYTVPKDESISEEVSDKGLLTIRDANGHILHRFQLTSLKAVNGEVKIPQSHTAENNQSAFSLYMFLILAGAVAAWFIMRRIASKRSSKYHF